MKLVNKISVAELTNMSKNMYEALVKAVVDIDKRLVVVDAGLHSDEEQYLLQEGSSQENLWGINLYPDEYGADAFIEFDSIINIRPRQNNRSRSVDDERIQMRIREIVSEVVYE